MKFSLAEIFQRLARHEDRHSGQLLCKADFKTAKLVETGKDDDDVRTDDAFRELSSSFPAAVPHEVSADDFVTADCNVRADSSCEEDRPNETLATRPNSAAEVAAAFGIHHSPLYWQRGGKWAVAPRHP